MQEKYQNNDEIEIDLRELWYQLLRHWKTIGLSMILVGAIAFVISAFLITPQYESTSELYVLSKSTSITSLADIQTGSNLTQDYMVVVKGRPVIEKVIRNLRLEENYVSLRDKISLHNPSDSRILEITVTDPDPAKAKRIADEMADVASAFISEKMDQDPPTIIQYGYQDEKPVNPNVMKNTVIGIMAGMFMAVVIVIVSYLLNDTIMSTDDIENKLELHLLGTLPLELAEDSRGKNRKNKKQGRKTA